MMSYGRPTTKGFFYKKVKLSLHAVFAFLPVIVATKSVKLQGFSKPALQAVPILT